MLLVAAFMRTACACRFSFPVQYITISSSRKRYGKRYAFFTSEWGSGLKKLTVLGMMCVCKTVHQSR